MSHGGAAEKELIPSENERNWANVPGEPGAAGSDEQGGVGDEGPVGGAEEAAQAVVLLLHCNRIGGDLHLEHRENGI